MSDFIAVDHPCLWRTKVPVLVKPPMTAKEFTDPATPVSENVLRLLGFYDDVPTTTQEGL
jgi:hypothetical protein